MVPEVKIGAGMDAFHFLEANGEFKFDIAGRIGIMRQFIVVMEPVLLISHPQCLMPFHTFFLPVFIPFHFGTGFYKVLHFHLFEFAHAQDELAGHNFVAKGFPGLGNAEGDLHPAGFLHVQKIDENTLGSFRPEVNGVGFLAHRTKLCAEHKIEFTHFRPVFAT
jgi:hypothetical protein